MFSRLAIAMFGFLLSSLAIAQDLPALATGSSGSQVALVEQLLALDDTSASAPWAVESNSVVPIWSGADGHLLAIVAVPGEWGSPLLSGTMAQAGPASWYLMGATTLEPSGLRWQANNGFHVDALFSQSQSVCLPSLCGARLRYDSRERTDRIARHGLDVRQRRARSLIWSFVVAEPRHAGFSAFRRHRRRRSGVDVAGSAERLDCSRKPRCSRAAAGVSPKTPRSISARVTVAQTRCRTARSAVHCRVSISISCR